ncbi:hypothetical protein FIBSPDRAFT_880666, partial [Athelia psychrophila]
KDDIRRRQHRGTLFIDVHESVDKWLSRKEVGREPDADEASAQERLGTGRVGRLIM